MGWTDEQYLVCGILPFKALKWTYGPSKVLNGGISILDF